MSYFGSHQVSFADAFPQVVALDIEITVNRDCSGFSPKDVRRYSLDSPPPASIRCKGKCSDGKYDVESIIRKAIVTGGGEIDDGSMCRGREPMGGGQSRSCTGGFNVKGTITVKETTTKGQ